MAIILPLTDEEVGIRTGLTAGARIWRVLMYMNGVSLVNQWEKLARLAAIVEDHALAEIHRTTNCATSMRWVWALAGCPHPLCRMPDEQIRQMFPGGPVDWDLRIAKAMGAHHPVDRLADALALLDEGWGIRYWRAANDDHMESCGGKPDLITGIAPHGGGGRNQNAITIAISDIRLSWGRPPADIIDPNFLITELRKFDENITPNLGDEIASAS